MGIPLDDAIKLHPELAALPDRHSWRWYTVPDDRGGVAALVGEHVAGSGYVEAMYIYGASHAAVVRVRTDLDESEAVWNHSGSLAEVISELAALGETDPVTDADDWADGFVSPRGDTEPEDAEWDAAGHGRSAAPHNLSS